MSNRIGNNGSRLAEYLNINGMLFNGISCEDASKIATDRSLMVNIKHLYNDDFWEDFYYRVEELGYTVSE